MSPIFGKRSNRSYPAASEGDHGTPQDQKTFEGRPLDRQNEDVEDQGLAFDLGTLVSRRRALGVFGAGASVFALAACSSNATSTSSPSASASSAASSASATPSPTATYNEEMPGETAGPYPGDGSNGQDALEISGIERSDITANVDGGTTADGVPMTLTMNIVDMVNSNGPLTGAAVYVWHCDAQGNYSMYSEGLEDATYLRGVQVVGDDGTVTFKTIFPGCYMGRWAHIHFEVFPDIDSITDAANAILTSQIALPEDACNTVYARSEYSGSAEALAAVTLESDNVFSDGWDLQMADVTGNENSGYTAHIDVPIDTSTEPEAGGGMGAPPA